MLGFLSPAWTGAAASLTPVIAVNSVRYVVMSLCSMALISFSGASFPFVRASPSPTHRLGPNRHLESQRYAPPHSACTPPLSEGAKLSGRDPAITRVVFGDGGRSLQCLFAQVFLIDDSITADNERHDSGILVLGWIRENRETIRHISIHDVVLRSTFGFISLFREYAEVVSVEWLRFFAGVGIPVTLGEVP